MANAATVTAYRNGSRGRGVVTKGTQQPSRRRVQVWVSKWLEELENAERKFFASRAITREYFENEQREYDLWLQRQLAGNNGGRNASR